MKGTVIRDRKIVFFNLYLVLSSDLLLTSTYAIFSRDLGLVKDILLHELYFYYSTNSPSDMF